MKETILVVDDERNIRLTLRRVLENMDIVMDEAVNGEEALRKLSGGSYALMLLDLRMPGMDGVELLRKIREDGNDLNVIVITAHGTVANAVEAMKLGAADFLQKPFTSDEIRKVVGEALSRRGSFFRPAVGQPHGGREHPVQEKEAYPAEQQPPPEEHADSEAEYAFRIQQAKAAIELRKFEDAMLWAERAISADPSHAEAFNLLGVLLELGNDVPQARKYYRVALSLDPSYLPARHNLDRTTGIEKSGTFDIGGNPGREPRGRRNLPGPLFRKIGKGEKR